MPGSKQQRQWALRNRKTGPQMRQDAALKAFLSWEIPIKAQYANAFGMKGGLEPTADEQSPAMLYNTYKSKEGANLVVNTTTSQTWTIAAGNTKRVQQLTALTTAVETHFTDYEFIPKYKHYGIRIQALSTGPFCLIPFAAILENGETINATDYNGDSVSTAVTTAMPAAQNRSVIYGPLVAAKLTTANNVDKYLCRLSFNFQYWASALAEHIRSKRVAEENPVAFMLGICAIGSASQVINWGSHDLVVYVLGEPKLDYMLGDN